MFHLYSYKQSFEDILQNRCYQKLRKFYRKTAILVSLFTKAAGLKACNFIKKSLKHRYFLVKFKKFLGAPFLTKNLQRLLLYTKKIPNVKLFNPIVAIA